MSEPWYSDRSPMDELEEGYWQSLLNDGEIVSSPPPEDMVGPPFNEEEKEGGTSVMGSLEEDWREAERARACMEVLSLPVTGYNRGGLLVQFKGLCGFVPASHLVDWPRQLNPGERLQVLARWVGQTIDVCIIEIDRAEGRLVMSERMAREGHRGREILQSLKPGDICRGRVTNLRPFGAFVDLGGIEGLIHISELSWGRVSHPREVLRPGDEIDVYVISVDCEQRRIALSLKRLKPNPWESVAERYHVGQIVTGVITNVVSFGAFARIEDGLEGLIHISELAEGQFLHPRNVVKEGDKVRVRILNIDPENHRMGLSMRRVWQEEPKATAAPRTPAPGTQEASTQEPATAW
ncbi:MAG TPA: S1 RNA-binding domain-containing protein [Caldilineae bacterium]|nr:S1 RNA-binding domain-containing protein [Caldilineae bacterium]